MVNIVINDDELTANLIGEIDHHTSVSIREVIDKQIQTAIPKLTILDFSRVTFMDSSGIGLVMGRYKLMKGINGNLKITGMSNNIKKVMMLAGLSKLVQIQ